MIQIEKTFISLFGGIGGFDKALTDRGWECKLYNDCDKYATSVYNKNFGTNWKARDIRKVGNEEIPKHSLLTAGFPCQSFSIAGKRMGFEDTRGTLFFEIARIVKEHRPQFLLLENVKGILSHDDGRTINVILATLDELGYDVEWECINSKYFSVPQNRERIFLVGHSRDNSSRQIFPLGQNNSKLSKKKGREQTISESGISSTLKAQYYKISADSTYVVEGEKKVNRLIGLYDTEKGSHQAGSVYDTNGIAPTLDDAQGGYREPLIVTNKEVPLRWVRTEKGKEARRESKEKLGKDYTPFNDGHRELVEAKEDIVGCVTHALNKDALIGNLTDYKIRRLTPTECERLQGFEDSWTAKGMENGKEVDISDTQRYKMCGNAITIPVVGAIVDALNKSLEVEQ